MKLIMTLLVRDEEDIIRENIEYHLAQGVDFIIATDNLSVDSTTEILHSYEEQGVLHYIHEPEDNYNQHAWVTRMARLACTRFGADWVINNDADEFWWPLDGDLRDVFVRLPDTCNVVVAQRHDFVATEQSSGPFYERMIYRKTVSLNPLGQPLPPKVAHKADARIRVDQGNHAVGGIGEQLVAHGAVEILHFPVRTRAQIENKIRKGGAAYENNDALPPAIGKTWRTLYQDLRRQSGLATYFEGSAFSGEKLRLGLESGDIVEDIRLRDALMRMVNS